MLPGRRQYSDEDIISVLNDTLSVFGNIEEDLTIPGDLRPDVFRLIANMVGAREVTQGADAILRGFPGVPKQ